MREQPGDEPRKWVRRYQQPHDGVQGKANGLCLGESVKDIQFVAALRRPFVFATAAGLALASCGEEAKPAADAGATADSATSGETAAGETTGGGDTGAAGETKTGGDAASTGDTATGGDIAITDATVADTAITDAVATDVPVATDVAADTAAAAPTCEAYCKVVVANCTGDNSQYKDEAECNNYCKTLGKLPVGAADDKAGNTVGCRTYHATAAKDDPKTHCSHAGKSGGNACGTWCDNYCHLADKSCLVAKQEMDVDTGSCLTKCKGLKDGGKANDAAGDTVQCRIYHLGVAGTDEANAKIHCPHGKIAPAAGTPCGAAPPSCESYCKTVTMHCTGTNAQYKDEAECVSYCKTLGKLPLGTADDKAGNTVGCRTYHAGAAGSDAALHCPHAGKSGGNACGTWVDNYCHLALANCTGDNKLYADLAACTAASAAAKTDGKPNDASGATLQCSIYHLGVAGTDAAAAKDHCPHGKIPAPSDTPCSAAATAPVTKEVKTTGANTFDPAETTIAVGDSVKFTNGSNHNAVEVDEATYTSGGTTKKTGAIIDVGFGATATVKFDKAGTYYFVCQPHAGMGMKGKIVVK